MKFRNKILSVVHIINYNLFRKRTPLSICWLITNRCNFKCSYCKIWNRQLSELNTKQVFSIIDNLKKNGTQRISIFGGEPLLRKDIGIIIDYIKQKNIFVGLGTNGYLIKDRLKEISNVDSLHVSFDGPKRVHDKQIDKGTYLKVLNGIKLAKQKNISVWATTVLTKYNVNEIDFILERAKEIGFTIYFQPVVSRALSGDVTSLLPDQRTYSNSINHLINLKKKKRYKLIITNSSTNLKILKNWPVHKHNIKCHSRFLRMLIDTNGDVYPCGFLIGKYDAKNIIKDGFNESFDNIMNMDCGDNLKKCNCWDYAILEFSKLFALNPDVAINSARLLNNYSN